jgi:hypothetical protein
VYTSTMLTSIKKKGLSVVQANLVLTHTVVPSEHGPDGQRISDSPFFGMTDLPCCPIVA